MRKNNDEVYNEIASHLEQARKLAEYYNAAIYGLERDVKELHTALDEITALFVSQHGFEYSIVKAALVALNRNRDRFPITLALAEKLDADKS